MRGRVVLKGAEGLLGGIGGRVVYAALWDFNWCGAKLSTSHALGRRDRRPRPKYFEEKGRGGNIHEE